MNQKLEQLISLAACAPSSHNTQPWSVRLEGKDLVVGYTPERQLTVGDPEKRELFMSLGAFIETLVQAAPALGMTATVAYAGAEPQAVARISLADTATADDDTATVIRNRRSDRRFYDATPLPEPLVTELAGLSEASVGCKLFTDSNSVASLAKATYDATAHLMAAQDFRDELARWVRNNWTKQPDGMPAYVQGMPGPVSLIAKFVIRKNRKVALQQARKDADRVQHSPAVGLITIADNSSEAWIAAGRLLQRVWLAAERNGLHAAAISAAVIDPDTANRLQKELSITGQPVALLRFGYKKGMPKASPRRGVNDIVQLVES